VPIRLPVDPIVWWFDPGLDASVLLERKEEVGPVEEL
jgi:hypothetical protein